MKHKLNRNLTIMKETQYKGLSVLSCDDLKKEGMIVEYLDKLHDVLHSALECHPRTTMVRIDLHFPSDKKYEVELMIKKFIASLKSQIQFDIDKKRRNGKKTANCSVRYAWVKERHSSLNEHYHLALFFNKDVYSHLGNYSNEDNLSYRIKKAWSSSLGIEISEGGNLVHFPDNCVYWINKKSKGYKNDLSNAFERISYLAKSRTKEYGNRKRSFGCSLK